jgi:hypothetical protein
VKGTGEGMERGGVDEDKNENMCVEFFDRWEFIEFGYGKVEIGVETMVVYISIIFTC